MKSKFDNNIEQIGDKTKEYFYNNFLKNDTSEEYELLKEMVVIFGYEQVISYCRLNSYKCMKIADSKENKEEYLNKSKFYINYIKEILGELK